MEPKSTAPKNQSQTNSSSLEAVNNSQDTSKLIVPLNSFPSEYDDTISLLSGTIEGICREIVSVYSNHRAFSRVVIHGDFAMEFAPKIHNYFKSVKGLDFFYSKISDFSEEGAYSIRVNERDLKYYVEDTISPKNLTDLISKNLEYQKL